MHTNDPTTDQSTAVTAAVRPSLALLGWSPAGPGGGLADVRAAFDRIAARLAEDGLVVLQERIYSEPEHVESVLACRAAALRARGLDPLTPTTVVANRPCEAGPCSGIHVLAVRLRPDETVQTVQAGRGRGRELRRPDGRALFVADVAPETTSTQPLTDLFEGLVDAVHDRGLELRDVARTWLYVADLVPTYQRLNDARDVVFHRERIKGADGWLVDPPASTGIQGFHPRGAPCFADLFAVHSTGGVRPFELIRPELQCEAWAYGSSFSRGMSIDLLGRGLVTISGTASIGGDGQTLHLDDREEQILETLRNIATLLDAAGTDPAEGLWTLYFKDEQAWQIWRRLEAAGRVCRWPNSATIFGDVCRDDLLFEAEVTLPGP
jgi:enamine deaminase RidA (YjgF/YER057c/UK114 family)